MADIYDTMQLNEIAYHRNGVAGRGFFAVRFTMDIDGKTEPFIGSFFPTYDEEDNVTGDGTTAVFQSNIDTIAFGVNSWRGDHCESTILKWVKEFRF